MKVNWIIYLNVKLWFNTSSENHSKTTDIFSSNGTQHWNVLIFKLITMLPSSKMLSTDKASNFNLT